jgi:hypothetical protein
MVFKYVVNICTLNWVFRTFALALLLSWCVMFFSIFLLYDIVSLNVADRPNRFGLFKCIIYVFVESTSIPRCLYCLFS